MKTLEKLFLLFMVIGISLVFSNCKKDKDEDDTQKITAPYYITVDIDGQNTLLQHGVGGYGNGVASGGGSTLSGYGEEQTMLFMQPLTENNSMGVTIIKSFPECPTECDQIEEMFHLGSYNYGKISGGSDEDGIDGVVVYYVDNTGVYWSTDQGTALQTGSHFEITQHTALTGEPYVTKKTKATFNCILYNESGASKTITNGIIVSKSVYCGSL